MKTIKEAGKAVEDALISLGITPEQARNEEEGQWTVYSETTEFYLDVWDAGNEQQALFYFQAANQPVFQIIAPFCKIPAERYEEFLEDISDINIGLFKASIVVRKDGGLVCIKYRSIEPQLTPEMVLETLDCVGFYVEFFTRVFVDKYGVSLLERAN
jgi:hypothetical protein